MEEPNILIKTALNDAVRHVNSGMIPTDALQKVATDLDLNPNYIQRVGEALNVALHYKHFKTAEDRSAEFEIADIPQVVQGSLSSNEKTAAEYASEHFSVSEANDVVFNYNRMLNNPMYKQAFLEIANADATDLESRTTLNTLLEKSAKYVQKLEKIAEQAEVDKTAAELDLNDKFSSMIQEFRKDASYRTSFEEFESQVYSKHGESAVPYLDLIHKTAKLREERGVHDSGYIMFEPCKEAQMFDGIVEAMQTFVESEKIAEEAKENLAYETVFQKEAHTTLGKQAKEEFEKVEDKVEKSEDSSEAATEEVEKDPVLEQIKKKAADAEYVIGEAYSEDPVLKEALEKEARFGENFSSFADSFIKGVKDDLLGGLMGHPGGAKGSGGPNLGMDNMQRKLLLQELLLTDPILSKVNPAKVAKAYEQLLRLSPEISKEKEVVRAELRAMVASQALSKYDADLMTKLDVDMLKRRVATQEFNRGFTDHFKI